MARKRQRQTKRLSECGGVARVKKKRRAQLALESHFAIKRKVKDFLVKVKQRWLGSGNPWLRHLRRPHNLSIIALVGCIRVLAENAARLG